MTQERMNSVAYNETFSDDIRALRRERDKGKGLRDDIAAFQNGDSWFVFDDDANRLFEVMGWQTSEKLMDEGAISWMNLSEEGKMALLNTDLNVISFRKHAGINIAGWSSEEDYKADRLSLAQQTLDYLLYRNDNANAIVNLGKFPIYSKDGDIDTTENVCFVNFAGRGCVNLFTESGKTINLVYGQEWNMIGGGDYIISTGNMLNAQREDVLHTLVHYDSVEMQRQLKTDDIMEICRLAVETNYWPLYEVVDGKWIVSYEPKNRLPIEEFLRTQGRFKHLFTPENEHLLEEYQREVDRRWEDLMFKASRG